MRTQIERKEEGQSLVLVTIAIVVIFVFVVLAVDIGNAYVHRRTDQNAADAAALAGARELAGILNDNNGKIPAGASENSILSAMNSFAEQNGICLLYTSDAADDRPCVDLGGRRILQKKTQEHRPDNRSPTDQTATYAAHRT